MIRWPRSCRCEPWPRATETSAGPNGLVRRDSRPKLSRTRGHRFRLLRVGQPQARAVSRRLPVGDLGEEDGVAEVGVAFEEVDEGGLLPVRAGVAQDVQAVADVDDVDQPVADD